MFTEKVFAFLVKQFKSFMQKGESYVWDSGYLFEND